ncbi:hypothetical protein NHP190002_12880 [Helicobacter ailurogastricus]|uniref:hypothetical protein n=1 Tax=Helicobacter ailurogastricus TaxID=1578720 RepID=UPI000CF1303B|nr:hypothetical protein [Helicobacter ailurogastricus]GMB90585.1 hypothetical protein NHP190002_12880 [Helicobacter ailurogastricus]
MDYFKIGQDAGTLWVELYDKEQKLTALQQEAMKFFYNLTNGYRTLYTGHSDADQEQTANAIANTLKSLPAGLSPRRLSLEVLKAWAHDPQREEELAECPILPERPFKNTPHYYTLQEINTIPGDELYAFLCGATEFARNLDPAAAECDGPCKLQ